MNLKLSRHQLRFRISSSELQALRSGDILSQRTVFPNDKALCVAIERLAARHAATLEYTEDRIILRLSGENLAALAGEAHVKEGISIDFGNGDGFSLICVVQVDLRGRRRRA